jgi:hypothetical protein
MASPPQVRCARCCCVGNARPRRGLRVTFQVHGKRNSPLLLDAEALLLVHGRNELEEKSVPKWLIFLKMVRSCPVAMVALDSPAIRP